MSALPKGVHILSPRERERLRNQIEQDKRRLKGELVVPTFRHIKESVPTRTMGRYAGFMDNSIQEDPGEIIKRMRRMQATLEQGSPRPLNSRQREKLEKQAVIDREWLRSQMCPKKLAFVKESDPDFSKAVEAAQREDTLQYHQVAERYKNAMRQLDTETPDASSVEKFRPN
jgi:hypothetical protein